MTPWTYTTTAKFMDSPDGRRYMARYNAQNQPTFIPPPPPVVKPAFADLRGTKLCKRCNIEKPKTEFYRMRSKYDGVQSHCKVCQRETCRIYHREYMRRERAKARAMRLHTTRAAVAESAA